MQAVTIHADAPSHHNVAAFPGRIARVRKDDLYKE
jgi:hypothetical protein